MSTTILIVDDEPVNVEYLAGSLQNDYIVKVAISGAKALEIVETTDIDLILLDIHMPGMNGYEVAQKIQDNKKTKSIPFIFLTGDNSEISLIKAFNAGAKDYILKPFNRTELLLRVKNHVDTYLLEKKLKDLSKKALQASRSKSDFLANMSHEIRTPMTGILGFVEMLCKDETDPKKIKYFQTIRDSGELLLDIINDILDFSKIESGKMEVELKPIDLHKAFEDSAKVFQGIAEAKNIGFRASVATDMPECILGDFTRLKQVVFNLISNAIKFTSQGGNVTIQGNYNKESKKMYIGVVDTGIGIAQDKLDTIFEAFSQEDTSTTRRFGGTGLGLSISSRLIALMGGELKVESEIGKGSKFFFEIPVEICSKEQLDQIAQNQSDEEEHHFDADVLVVEDNKTNQMLMGMILQDLGVRYDIANDGAEGVLKAKHKNYDLILMDENMPHMNGIEATKIIRENEDEDQHIPIVAVTANALVKDRERFLAIGMDDYVSKPYTEDDIVRIFTKYL